ncbi:MAG: peptidylprolyl isomerase [Gammaproteobacteria bacterium]|jgi:peptidyl-prolyl cis-trans isomerase A (cyclophilin A)
MERLSKIVLFFSGLFFSAFIFAANPSVEIKTNQGVIIVELDQEKAPISTKNFLMYADKGYYDNTLFHRVIPGFMIQGGGFTKAFRQKPTDAPIQNEANNGLKNTRGTIAMARTNDPNSATSQFFINLADNPALDYHASSPGYAVFGHVTSGMDVVDKIARERTEAKEGHQDVPVTPVVIESVKRVQ